MPASPQLLDGQSWLSSTVPWVLSGDIYNINELTGLDIDSLGKTLENTLQGPVSLLNRMRLACMPLTKEGNALACTKTGM